MSYEAVESHIIDVLRGLVAYLLPGELLIARIDCTGVGKPVYDHIRVLLRDHGLRQVITQGVVFLAGERPPERRERDGLISLGKGYLVGRINVLLSEGRIRMADSEKAAAIRQELSNFVMRSREQASQLVVDYSAEGGARDDLVIALGLAVLYEVVDYEGVVRDEPSTPRFLLR
jgi:hypothetical protein